MVPSAIVVYTASLFRVSLVRYKIIKNNYPTIFLSQLFLLYLINDKGKTNLKTTIMTKVLKKDQRNFVREQLGRNEKWAKNALLKIYEYQTEDEQNSGYTKVYNNVGFSGADSEILSSFAQQLLRKGWLSPKQMNIVYKKMPKYSRQIIEISDKDILNKLVTKNLN